MILKKTSAAGCVLVSALLCFSGDSGFSEASEAELKLARVAPTFFQVRLFSKFEEREIDVIDAEKKVTRVSVTERGEVKVVDARKSRLVNESESFQFPEGVYRVIPRAHASYGRSYRGSLRFGKRVSAGGGNELILEPVLSVSEEDYLASVIACERILPSGLEAQKALAVCVRSFSRYLQQSEGKKIFSDLTDDQVFKGMEMADASSLLACLQTAGLVLLTADELFFPAYYASTAGRMTTTPAGVWSRGSFEHYFLAVSNFRSSGEWLDRRSPHSHWSFVLPSASVSEWFPRGKGRPEIEYQNGKITELRFGEKSLSGWSFRQAVCLRYGWASMKSLECRIQVEDSGAWSMSGSGFGHGVGLSVYGSAQLAEEGLGFRNILAFYFPRLKVSGQGESSN